jgi:hypothetical protein
MKLHHPNTLALWLTAVTISVTAVSCDDDDNNCKAGSGGNVTLILKPQHHGEPIFNQPTYPDSAFIAFDEAEFPGEDPAQYDIISTGVTGTDHVVVNGLKCGKYFVFMTGFDTSIVDRVKGGVPIEITAQSGSVTKIIPITED